MQNFDISACIIVFEQALDVRPHDGLLSNDGRVDALEGAGYAAVGNEGDLRKLNCALAADLVPACQVLRRLHVCELLHI